MSVLRRKIKVRCFNVEVLGDGMEEGQMSQ